MIGCYSSATAISSAGTAGAATSSIATQDGAKARLACATQKLYNCKHFFRVEKGGTFGCNGDCWDCLISKLHKMLMGVVSECDGGCAMVVDWWPLLCWVVASGGEWPPRQQVVVSLSWPWLIGLDFIPSFPPYTALSFFAVVYAPCIY